MRGRLAAFVVIACAAPAVVTADEIPLPGPAPRAAVRSLPDIGAVSNEACARCHEEIAAEWRGSLHQRAWNNAYFVRSFAQEPTPFCRKCHAPEADQSADPSPDARHAGVGCVTCHVVPGGVVGVRATAANKDAHATIGDARLATAAACGACHQFAFPAPPGVETGPMQDTLGEHARSSAAGTPCQGCHMPKVTGPKGRAHRSHAFRVQGDATMLAKAVEVKRAELSRGEVRLTIAPGAIGHAFPTGDLFRQAEVRAFAIDAGGRALSAPSVEVLGRTFRFAQATPHTVVQSQRTDTRLVGPRVVTLSVPEATRRARYQVVWQRLPPPLAAKLGLKMSEHEAVVVEGEITR